jgi:hypothetical protein
LISNLFVIDEESGKYLIGKDSAKKKAFVGNEKNQMQLD